MQTQFEMLMKNMEEVTAEAVQADSTQTASTRSGGPSNQNEVPSGVEDSFQETIRQTMQRMQESGDQATAAATADDTDDILAEMLRQMQGSGFEGPGNEEDFSKMLLGMMEQLTNKEILYEPMKELHDKFPSW